MHFAERKMQGMYPFSDSVFLMCGDSKVIVKSRIGKKGKKILPLSAYKEAVLVVSCLQSITLRDKFANTPLNVEVPLLSDFDNARCSVCKYSLTKLMISHNLPHQTVTNQTTFIQRDLHSES